MSVLLRAFSALPLILSATTYGVVYFRLEPTFGLDTTWLTQIFMLEFLAIHSLPFLTLVVLWNPAETRLKGLRWLGFGGLLLLYLMGAYSIAKGAGVVGLGVMIFSTYFGFLVGNPRGIEIRELIARGSANFVIFLGCIAVNRLPQHVEEWENSWATLRTGLLYFTILAVMELSGLYKGRWLHEIHQTPHDDPAQRSPATSVKEIFHEAVMPLVNSVGLAVAPYILVPIVAGFVARLIDDAVAWPTSVDLIRYWYLVMTVLGLWLARCHQIRITLSKATMIKWNKGYRRFIWYLVPLLMFCGIGIYASFYRGRIVFERWWTIEEMGIFICPDFLLLLILIPATWAITGSAKQNPSNR